MLRVESYVGKVNSSIWEILRLCSVGRILSYAQNWLKTMQGKSAGTAIYFGFYTIMLKEFDKLYFFASTQQFILFFQVDCFYCLGCSYRHILVDWPSSFAFPKWGFYQAGWHLGYVIYHSLHFILFSYMLVPWV